LARKIGAIFGLALLLLAGPVTADAARPLIAIIIDDLGYERAAGERAIRLPGPVTFAVLPCTPRGSYLAERAHAAGKDVILHLPLQAESRDQKPDPGSLLLDMSRAEFVDTLRADMATVPYLSGINSHRGSLLTRHPGHMGWLMDEIARHESLFFVDSYTTAESVALVIAAENGVPSIKRDVFLDPDRDPATLPREFARLKKLADAQGFAVGIGHPYAATLDFLESALPGLYADGYELVRVSSLVDTPARNAMTQFKPGAD
jgi:hypothetical protein